MRIIEFIAFVKRLFTTLLTYRRYHCDYYRKNKSLNNHIRVIEPSRIVGKWEKVKKKECVCTHTCMHTCILSTHM